MRKLNVAVVGATGLVGQTFLSILEERAFPIEKLYLFASARSTGKEIVYDGKTYIVEELTEQSFDREIDIALFSAGGGTSTKFAPIAAKKGAVVIDNSSAWRMDEAVPLIVPEVNASAALKHKGIIANPNCSTIQAVVALQPIREKYGIERIVYSTYQAVSGSGVAGIADLENGLKGGEPKKYPKPIAGNCLPHIDVFLENGYTKEEWKMVDETHKIFDDYDIRVTATTVRVPVLNGHSEAINVETKRPFELEDVIAAFKDFKGLTVMDDTNNNLYPTPLEVSGQDDVFVGRIRRDFSVENGLNLWVVGDNIRKGAALNAVQIAEYIAEHIGNTLSN